MTHGPSSQASSRSGGIFFIAAKRNPSGHILNSIADSPFAPRRICTALAFAATLALLLSLAPLPAFAQHGGGGGGHAGGGGGHGGFGGSHGGGTAAGSRGGSPSGNAPAGYGGGTSSGKASGNSGGSARGAAPSRFIGTSTWQPPPSAARSTSNAPSSHFVSPDEAAASGTRVAVAPVEPKGMRGPLSASTTLRGRPSTLRTTPYASQFVGAPPHVPRFPPRQPVFFNPFFGFGGCFGPFFFGCGGFYSGFYGFGFGYGYCDPFWGCPAGYGYGGYYNGGWGYSGNQIYNDSSDGGSYESAPSNEFNPSRFAYPPEEPAKTGGGSSSDATVVLFLKDGTVYAVTEYWVADNKLHYVTNYGGENAIDLDTIDMQRTVDVNAKRGVTITLRPTPQTQAAPDAPPVPPDAPTEPYPPAPPPDAPQSPPPPQ
jgi:hypothetical protein